MNEIIAATIGAAVSILLVAINNITARRDRDIREIFNRLNRLEQDVAANMSRKDWRNR
jgi:type IV secretory pathway TrbD component